MNTRAMFLMVTSMVFINASFPGQLAAQTFASVTKKQTSRQASWRCYRCGMSMASYAIDSSVHPSRYLKIPLSTMQ